MNLERLKQLFPKASESFLRANADNGQLDWAYKSDYADGVPHPSELEPNPRDESVGAPEGASLDTAKRLVRVKSFRLRLLDERNIWDKYIVDSLVRAGLLRDDSPEFCKVEVEQVKVASKAEERTEIVIEMV